MLNQQTLEGQWNEVKGKVREKWGQLTDDDIESFRGRGDQLVGAIQRKTGEARDQIERYINDAMSTSAGVASRAAESARQYAQQAGDNMQDVADQVSDTFRKGYEQAESIVHERPAETLAVAFGLGVVVGAIVGLMLRHR